MSKKIDFGFLTQHQEKGSEIIRLAKLAEDIGFGGYWVPEDPYYRGSFVTAATIAAHTTKMMIGTSVINPFLRHPVAIAQEWAALDDYSEGRAILGIAAGASVFLKDQLNLPWKKPLTAVRETVDIFEKLIAGEAVSYEGELFNVSNLKMAMESFSPKVKLSIPTYKSKIPIHLGAGGPKFLQFCGERLDGMILPGGGPVNPESMRFIDDNLKIGAAKTGRDVNDIDITLLMNLSISENDQEARNRMKQYIALMMPSFLGDLGLAESYEKRGWFSTSFLKELKEASIQGEDPADLITDEILDEYVVSGSPERCKELIARMIEMGINRFVLVDYSNYMAPYGIDFDVETSMRLFAEKVMPEFL